MKWLFDLLRDPSVKDMDVNAGDRISVHSQIFQRRRMLREVFTEFHHQFHRLDRRYFSGDGLRIELGAGVAPIRETYPDVLATDVVAGPGLDRILDAQNMDLEAGSVRAFFGQNCFHHFPHPENFFAELGRVLSNGGGAVLLEPYHGPVASVFYPGLHRTEGFDKKFPSWNTPVSGPMSGANQALSYIVFDRDRKEFEKQFPNLKIVHQEVCSNYLKYLLSGGLNFRQLSPNWTTPAVDAVQGILSPLNKWIGLHHVIVLRKGAS